MTDRGPIRALLYGDVDLNVIDGSAVWVASTAEVLARAGCEVTLVLRGRVTSRLLLESLDGLGPRIATIEPTAKRLARHAAGTALTPRAAVETILDLERERPFDLLVIRGLRIARLAAAEPKLAGRLWTYLTDVPQSVVDLDAPGLEELTSIVRASRVVLCQTEDLRTYLESMVGAAVGRTALMPPVVPGAVAERDPNRPDGRPLRLVYAGKFAPLWKTLEMTGMPARLAERGVEAGLTMIGDKIHTDPADPTYPDRMTAALRSAPGVDWVGPRSRAETMDLVRGADIGLGWRGGALDGSLELSTKVLEYGAAGLPAVLDRTPMHERLLGDDYPLFAGDGEDLVDVLAAAATDPGLLAEAAGRCRAAAEAFTMTPSVNRMRSILARELPPPLRAGPASRRLRVGIAGHDLKFFNRILDRYRSLPDVEVRLDEWPSLHRQDVAASRRLAAWADVIVCEWCGPNAVWYSHHLRPGQRLIVRLHRFELYGRWLADLDIDRVDRLICVSESYAAMTRTLTGWPASKIAVVPNWVDDVALDRPKHPGAQFHLGFLGMAPARKRLDRALDVLESLRDRDPRFRLFVKSKLPWDYPWVWRWPEERRSTDLLMRRVQTSPLLRGSVVFDDFGPDVGSWLRRIGFVLSTSDDESFHLAPAEGMASRAVPAILDWPGADTIYDRRWIAGSTAELAGRIAAVVAEDRFATEGEAAYRQAVAAFGLDRIGRIWERLLIDDVELPGPLVDLEVPA